MTIRSVVQADAAALVAMWNRSAPYDLLTDALFAEKVFGDPDFDEKLTLIAEEESTLSGFAMAVRRRDSEIGYLKLLAVDPVRRRRGIATQLCDRLEAELAERSVKEIRVCESAPNYLTPGVDVRLDEMHEFLASRGYAETSEAVNMRVKLPVMVEPSQPADGVRIERAGASEADSLDRLLGEHWPSWRGEVAIAQRAVPPTLFVAKQAGRAVGFCAYEANNLGTGWFGPMGTDPEAQGRGIGKALLLRTLEQMATDGFTGAIIPWVGPTEFYAKTVNATIDRRFQRYRKSL